MYVQLNVELITKTIELFCQRKDIQMKKKDAKKVFALLVGDEDVEKYNLCKAICTKSNRPCMKEVAEGTYCHLHDPERRCHGVTNKGDRCKCVAKAGEKFCWRHIPEAKQEEPTERKRRNAKITKENSRKYARLDHVDPEENPNESTPEKSHKHRTKHNKSKKSSKHKRPDIIIPRGKMNPEATNLTLDNLAPGMFYGWEAHPTNKKLEYATNYTINDKCIVKLVSGHGYVELCSPEQLQENRGNVLKVSVQERMILEKMGLRPMFPIEQMELHGDNFV
jgi:hypothetical protein